MMQEKENRGWRTLEFLLVVIMLLTLTILVVAVLLVPPCMMDTSNTTPKDMLDYQKNILTVIPVS